MVYHQVVVVGGGLSGLRAAISARDAGLDVAVLSQVYPVRSHSGAAQGGINAALANAEGAKDDNWEKHAFDTTKGSDYLADQDAVEVMTKEAILRVYEMEHWGVPFSRFEDGTIAQRPFGGAGYPRTCYAADKTGHFLLHAMYEQSVKRHVKVYTDWIALSLIVENGVCKGLIGFELVSGRLEIFQAEAVIFATGGAGRIYSKSTNAIINTGSAMAIAYRAGVPLKDMEFIQFHPTCLYGSNILISEAVRGEGGYLVNNQGERYMKNYVASAMELAPRDIVSRSTQIEINEGRGFENAYVHLDLRHLGREKILERLPGIRDLSITFAGVDPIDKPIPILPAQHYTMGGIDTDYDGASLVPGFYAAGECACVSVHGANRLGGNSLLETIVFGKRAGDKATEYVQGKRTSREGEKAAQQTLTEVEAKIANLMKHEGKESLSTIRDEMGDVMMEDVGIFRQRSQMENAVEKTRQLQERYQDAALNYRGNRFNLDLVRGLELGGMLEVAEVIAMGALMREESRGSHSRLDFSERDDAKWLKHTIANRGPDGPQLTYRPVTITRFTPEARKY